jgi:hypothetical protein
MVWAAYPRPERPKKPGLWSKPSSRGIAHRWRLLRDTKRAEDPPPARRVRVNKSRIADFGSIVNLQSGRELCYLSSLGSPLPSNLVLWSNARKFRDKCAVNLTDEAKELLWEAAEFTHSRSTLLNHLVGTYQILCTWGMPQEICRAGLFHSIYSTQYYNDQLISEKQRDRVALALGPTVERLVFLFCKLRREEIYNIADLGEYATHANIPRHDTHEKIKVARSEIRALVILECANIAEQSADKDWGPAVWINKIARWCNLGDLAGPFDGYAEHLHTPYSDAISLRLYRWLCECRTPDEGEAFLSELVTLSPLPGEIYLLAGLSDLCLERFDSAVSNFSNAHRKLLALGTAWDKRLPLPEWILMEQSLLNLAREKKPTRNLWDSVLAQIRNEGDTHGHLEK